MIKYKLPSSNNAFTLGQYKEVNPGQYTLDDKDIEVDVNNRYNILDRIVS